jgi:hypothetical protein
MTSLNGHNLSSNSGRGEHPQQRTSPSEPSIDHSPEPSSSGSNSSRVVKQGRPRVDNRTRQENADAKKSSDEKKNEKIQKKCLNSISQNKARIKRSSLVRQVMDKIRTEFPNENVSRFEKFIKNEGTKPLENLIKHRKNIKQVYMCIIKLSGDNLTKAEKLRLNEKIKTYLPKTGKTLLKSTLSLR